MPFYRVFILIQNLFYNSPPPVLLPPQIAVISECSKKVTIKKQLLYTNLKFVTAFLSVQSPCYRFRPPNCIFVEYNTAFSSNLAMFTSNLPLQIAQQL